MKIDLDLDEIFDEEGNVDDSIKERIIQTITNKIYTKIERDISKKLNEIVEKEIKEKVSMTLSLLMPSLLDYEFTPTSSYGSTKEKTTVKNSILEAIKSECTWGKGHYASENTAFTNTIIKTVENQMTLFKPQLDKELNAAFVKEALDYAQKKLQEKLGIK